MGLKKQASKNITPINVGLIGFGNVGGGVVEYFQKGGGEPQGIRLKRVAVASLRKPREFKAPGLTDSVQDIFNDPEINIVVELIGGLDPARKYMLEAINKGKSVVTANKAVLALYAKELFDAARSQAVDIGFEASVGGGIPIIRIVNGLRGEKIKKIMGILNGTTNFILSQMENGLDFKDALAIAQEKGFAEANHLLDTGGFDARDKLAILASLIFNTQVDPKKIHCEGITDITPIDIDFAAKYETDEVGKGYAVKLLAVAEESGEGIALRVHPALIRKDHPLAAVQDEFNAIYAEGELAGPHLYSGRGAGRHATTSAVVSNILEVASNIRRGTPQDLPTLDSEIKYADVAEIEARGYMRVNLLHKPGSAVKVFSILGRHNCNVVDSIQRKAYKQPIDGEEFIPDIITIEPISARIVEKALKEVAKSSRVYGKPFFLRFEE